MSGVAVSAVIEHPVQLYGADRAVAIVVAERCDEHGRGCWSGVEDIARRANLCHFAELAEPGADVDQEARDQYRRTRENAIRSAKRSLAAAERKGVIRDEGTSAYGTRTRGIIMPGAEGQATLSQGQGDPPKPGHHVRNPDTVSGPDTMSDDSDTRSGHPDTMSENPDMVSPKPSVNRSSNSSGEPGSSGGAPDPPSGKDDDYEQLVQRVFAVWKTETGAAPNARLTPKRRAAIDRAFEHYEVEEVEEAIRHWRNSPFHRGDNKSQKVFNDLTWLLKDDDTIEELRDCKGQQSASDFIAQINSRRGAHSTRPAIRNEVPDYDAGTEVWVNQ